MRLSLFVLWAIVGWCGTFWLRGWRRVRIPPPIPDPFPEPPPDPWLIVGLAGIVGGIVGGWAFTAAFGPGLDLWTTAGPHPEPWMPLVRAAATTVGALLGANLLSELYGLVRGGGKATRG